MSLLYHFRLRRDGAGDESDDVHDDGGGGNYDHVDDYVVIDTGYCYGYDFDDDVAAARIGWRGETHEWNFFGQLDHGRVRRLASVRQERRVVSAAWVDGARRATATMMMVEEKLWR